MEPERKFGLGVVMVIANRDFSKILLLKRNEEKRARNGFDWGNVGGKVELGEYLIDACIREAKEEIGVDLDPKNIELLEIVEAPFISKKAHAIYFIYATLIDEDEEIRLNFNGVNESEEFCWFDLENIPEKTIDSKELLIKWTIRAKERFKKE